VDGICVGEPWNSVAVERGVGRIVLVTAQIWRRGVEKVLAMKSEYLEEQQPLVERLVRVLHKTAAHFIDASNWDNNADILSQADYLDGSKDLIKRAISDQIMLHNTEQPMHIPDFMFQYREAANFPWKSQAAWIYSQMLRWDRGTYNAEEQKVAEAVFRSNVYRAALDGLDAPMPGANSKVEGAFTEPEPVAVTQGRLTLSADPFFDGRIFDPEKIVNYISDK